MCGIAGVVGLEPEKARQCVEAINDHQMHRGPDAVGLFHDEHICLGHRRLSIVDLNKRSDQPFFSADKRYVMVFNGEIYNHLDLRRELKHYTFSTNSDTETLLAAYIQWGAECLQKLRGMFAFAIWDRQVKSLLIARDRLGIKPCYYSTANGLCFASELRAILATGLVKKEIDQLAVQEYLSCQMISAPRTIIAPISQLKPGHYAVFENGQFKEKAYWRLSDIKINQNQPDLEAIRACLRKSVSIRQMSDVPLAVFLSGGIDSSAIVGLLAESSEQPINTFSLGFHEPEYDESRYAALIAQRFNTRHEQVIISAEQLLSKIPRILQQTDSPTADGVNTNLISEAVKKVGIKVALSGLGGDELFAGYPVFRQLPKAAKHPVMSLPLAIRKLLSSAIAMRGSSLKNDKLQSLFQLENTQFQNIYPIFRRITREYDLKKLLRTPVIEKELHELNSNDSFDLTSLISAAELSSYTPNILLKDTDQMSMAHSIEARVPLLDHKLVELVLSVPEHCKSKATPKALLTDTIQDLLPMEIIARKKQGFALPWVNWLRKDLKDFSYSQLCKLTKFGVVDQTEMFRLWSQFQSSPQNTVHWSKVWTLVTLGHWLEQNLN